jgi:hypothetical protein
MLKMTVRPLAIRDSSIPYSTPLSVECDDQFKHDTQGLEAKLDFGHFQVK